MKMCPMCNAIDHIYEAGFCYKDGTALVERPIHSCGYQFGKYDIFCPKCGEKIESSSRAPQRSEGEAAIPEAQNAASLPTRDATGHVPATFDVLGAGPKYSYEDANESRFGPGR